MNELLKVLNISAHALCICCVALFLPSPISVFILFSFNQFSEFLFFFAIVYFSCGLSKLWWTPKVRGWVQAHHNLIWQMHGPAMTLVLLCCHTFGWLKYLGGVVALTTIYSCGNDMIDDFGKWDYDTILGIVKLNAHHLGGMIALYFQNPEDAFLNSLLFGHCWWIHSFSGFGIDEMIKHYWEKFTGYKCTKFGHGYGCFSVFFAALYCYYLPVGLSYHTCAMVSLCSGRHTLFNNWLNVEWMGKIELPGILFCFTCKSLGLKAALMVLAAYVFLFRWKNEQMSAGNLIKPPQFFMTEKIRKFLDSYPRQEKNEEKIKESTAVWDSFYKDDELPVHRAIMASDEVKLKELIEDNGADPNHKESKWQSTPMSLACAGGHINCACVLLAAGVNPFQKGMRKEARSHGHTHFLKFLDDLTPLVWEALREETGIQHERQEPMTWKMANELAKTKGGRLCSEKEAEKYLMGAPLFNGEVHVCAVTGEDGKQKWIHVGNKFFKTGEIIENEADPKFWGNDLESVHNGHFKWNEILLWTLDSDELDLQSGGSEIGA